MTIVGYCDHPNNYWSRSAISERVYWTEKEECGMRTCAGCFYFTPLDFEGDSHAADP